MNTHNILYHPITLNYPKSAALGFKNEVKTAMGKEPSVFEPLKVCCIMVWQREMYREKLQCMFGLTNSTA